MSTIKYKTIKWGVYMSPQSGNNEFERYVVESLTDLENYIKKFPKIKSVGLDDTIKKYLNKGKIILLTDTTFSGFPSWCTESEKTNTHPSSFHRVKLGEIKNN